MSQRRLEKMNGLLLEAIAEILAYKSKDQRLRQVTLTGVRTTADLKRAVVHYSLLGDAEDRKKAAEALSRAAGFVRSSLGEALRLKYTPEVVFEFDRNLEYAQHMTEVLDRLTQAEDTPKNE